MASGLTPTKRFAVRASLVTGSTVALIVGAQTLITVDVQAGRTTQDDSTSTSNVAVETSEQIASSGVNVIRQANAASSLNSSAVVSLQNGDELLNQQPQLNQPTPLPTVQPSRRPRTHSSH